MSLAAIFSLIFATLLGLLPIFLLVGRRVIASRLSRRGESTSESAATAPDSESAILDRLIRARRGAEEPRRESSRVRAATVQDESAHLGGGSDRTNDEGSRIEARLGRLSVLQRAVVYREILGPPVGLRAPGEHERY